MDYSDLLKKVHKIEIKAKGLSRNVFSGQYRSAFKGRGMTFSEVREYTYGDEVRDIDWNVSARFNHPFVKVYEEERELTIMLMIDVSASTGFGSKSALKTQTITEIAAILAFSAIMNNDKVGALLFSDKVELFISPKKGTQHCLRIIRELLSFKPTQSKTSFSSPFAYISNVIKRRCTCFFITDALGEFDKSLDIFASKHDTCAIIVNDKMEYEFPNLGLVLMEDLESKEKMWVDTSSKQTRSLFAQAMQEQKEKTESKLKKLGIDYVNVLTDSDYTKSLIKLFANRERL